VSTALPSQDDVAVLRADLSHVFVRARAIKASVSRASKAMEHPIETGATITDHRIILPVMVDLSLLLVSADYQAVYQQVRDLFIAGELLTVQTRADSFPSMLIEKMPHDESTDVYDGVTLALTLKQAQFVQPQFSTFKVAQPKDSNTVPRGQQEGSTSTRSSSILSGVL
jgi:hypothetical protein